jgi:hypothetical protein
LGGGKVPTSYSGNRSSPQAPHVFGGGSPVPMSFGGATPVIFMSTIPGVYISHSIRFTDSRINPLLIMIEFLTNAGNLALVLTKYL